jgi:CheY-like chemotaxis protein
VVEDHDDSRDALRLLLESFGAAVVVAESAASALAVLEVMAPPDLLLADIRMPSMNGLQLASHLSQDLRWREIPLIAVSAGTTKADLHATLTAGFLAHIPKPIEPDALEATLRAIVADRRPHPIPDPLRCGRCGQGIETRRGYIRDKAAPYHPRCFPPTG